MQILLLFCLIKNFLFKDYYIERYGSRDLILNENDYIFLKILQFFKEIQFMWLLNHLKKNILIILNIPIGIMSQVMI